ncbi:ABC transporter ATP-binding protein [Flavobacterium sp. SUN052]|uniref:ABC transporter ATP-binding protein n=1 Tax=Flavobacterium sp. SUN052 TaxID=3002441 RepID=UPI00237E3F1A|nr:ABC transporter ATP-binding protein [Flavobacterium sp. SUN052]MEC4003769.1 ABC transporter ATP-binding protein [Flavobacterium sp. SUN052]
MNEFEKQFEELQNFLKFEDFSILTKRIIDLTLDTEELNHYKKTNEFLIWLDQNESIVEGKKEKFKEMLTDLYATLSKKPVAEKQLLVSTSKLEKSYGNSSFGLGPIEMELHQGEILGLVGENGNGKTTLLRCLCGELFATSGKIKYHFKSDDEFDLRTKLVYIPQRTDTWYGSMFENLQFTAASYGYKPEENELVVELTIARLGLRKFRNHAWKSLSSGYKMRFELARMLLRKPKILLIDEPLANLDILAQQTVLEDFRAIAKSPFRPIGIVLSSQQLYEVEKTSDQVIFLKHGKQKNLHEKVVSENEIAPEQNLVIEFESEWSQSQLGEVFTTLNMISLQFNGGTYIVNFPEKITIYDFMKLSIEEKIPLQYFRNISNSTRRFFVS